MKKYNGLIKTISIGLITVLVLGIGSMKFMEWYMDEFIEQRLGTAIPVSVAVFETTLASKITSTATTSMTMVSGASKGGTDFDGYMCFTLDGGKTNEEFVCGTASSTVVSDLTRGVDQINPNSTTTAYTHRAGSNIKVTDWPLLGILARIMDGDDTFPNILSYATNTAVFTTDSGQIPNVRFVETTATSGAPEASWIKSGLVELATTSEFMRAIATSTATRYLVPSNSLFSTTTGAYKGVVANASGTIDQGFLNLADTFTFTATTGFATSTFNNTIDIVGAIVATSTLDIGGDFTVFGTSTMATTTFLTIPILPTSTATDDYQVPSKVYVDDLFSGLILIHGDSLSTTTFQVASSTGSIGVPDRVSDNAFAAFSCGDALGEYATTTFNGSYMATRYRIFGSSENVGDGTFGISGKDGLTGAWFTMATSVKSTTTMGWGDWITFDLNKVYISQVKIEVATIDTGVNGTCLAEWEVMY